MAGIQEIIIPDLGTESVTVTELLVSIGDLVEEEQGLMSVEGDKASMDLPSPFAGKIISISMKVGDVITAGMVFGTIDTAAAGEPASTPAEAVSQEATAAQATETALSRGTTTSVQAVEPRGAEVPSVVVPRAAVDQNQNVYASPSIRRMANRLGVDLTRVTGTGRKDRILKEDVEAFIKAQLSQPAAAPGGPGGPGLQVIPLPKIDFAKYGEIEEVPLTKIQQLSGPALHRNWVTVPHVTQFDESDITELEEFRQRQNTPRDVKERGYKITPLVFIMKAVAKTLELHPKMNASLSHDGMSLVMKKYVHLGIAVDTANGLVVPVIRDVNKRTISDLSQDLFETSKKAREGQLTIENMKGSSFTISSLGGIGGTNFTPIINAPDVGILGVSQAKMCPVWNGKKFKPRLMLPLALSYDHRIIDGADAARFITTLRGELEDIRKIIL
ncbi:MAG: 2-oxo acid dehydrogenase subunit E2 [Myxococcota bacterium]|nr:2-oxo acid dehydrogenase subunit E2 [Myxococcota bacterium]